MDAERLMTVDVTCVGPDIPIGFAWTVMQELGTRHLPVVDADKLLGILSNRDLLLHATPGKSPTAHEFPDVPASKVMARNLITCAPDATVSQVAALMLKNRVDCVPVVRPGGLLVGLVTSTDLVRLLADRDGSLPFSWSLHRR